MMLIVKLESTLRSGLRWQWAGHRKRCDYGGERLKLEEMRRWDREMQG